MCIHQIQANNNDECDGSLKLKHLTDTRSTQVFPYDLDPGNYSHPKNQATQTEQLQRRNNGNQTRHNPATHLRLCAATMTNQV